MRKMFLLASLVALAVGLGGCGKKDEKKAEEKGGKAGAGGFTCEAVAKKNEQCANDLGAAFVAMLGDDVPQEMKDKIAARTKERMAGDRWIVGCKRRWDSDKERHKAQKASMEKCFGIADCKEYAKCFVEATGMGRGRHKGRMGRRGLGGDMDAMGGEAPMDAMGEAPADAMGEAPMDAMGEAPMDAME